MDRATETSPDEGASTRSSLSHQHGPSRSWLLALSLLLGACASTPGRGGPGYYAWDSSVSAACRQNPANCAAAVGRESVREPLHTAATIGGTIHAAQLTWDSTRRQRVEAELVECADGARSKVLLDHGWRFKGVGPTDAECNDMVLDKQGRSVTLAMLLGQEMHEEALWCAEQRLRDLRPGGYSLEPRYRYENGRTTHITPEKEAELLSQQKFAELEGTLKPDAVIHSGDPLRAQAVYDFKFPCVNTDRIPAWNRYPTGHPHAGSTQGVMYQKALNADVARIVPRLGVIR
jgi:hypothetical protein